jgi:hypothetical protein
MPKAPAVNAYSASGNRLKEAGAVVFKMALDFDRPPAWDFR